MCGSNEIIDGSTEVLDNVENIVDNITQIGVKRNMVIDTPLIRIEFKQYNIGDNIVDGARGLLPVDMFNTLADKLCVGLASRVITLQESLCGREAIADNKAARPSSMFEGTTLKAEYASKKTDAQRINAERLYAEVLAYNETLKLLTAQYNNVYPLARNGIQYAFVGQAAANMAGTSIGPIYSPREAVAFRIATNPTRRSIVAQVERKRAGGKEIEALERESIAEALGF